MQFINICALYLYVVEVDLSRRVITVAAHLEVKISMGKVYPMILGAKEFLVVLHNRKAVLLNKYFHLLIAYLPAGALFVWHPSVKRKRRFPFILLTT